MAPVAQHGPAGRRGGRSSSAVPTRGHGCGMGGDVDKVLERWWWHWGRSRWSTACEWALTAVQSLGMQNVGAQHGLRTAWGHPGCPAHIWERSGGCPPCWAPPCSASFFLECHHAVPHPEGPQGHGWHCVCPQAGNVLVPPPRSNACMAMQPACPEQWGSHPGDSTVSARGSGPPSSCIPPKPVPQDPCRCQVKAASLGFS